MFLKYRPQNLIFGVVLSIPVFLFGGYGAYLTAGMRLLVPYLIFLLLLLFLFVNRKIVLSDNTIQITKGFKRDIIEFKDISSIVIKSFRPRFSKISVPALNIHSGGNNIKPIHILYLPYKKTDVVDIINFILVRNKNIEIDHNIKLVLNNEKSSAETMFNRSNWIGIITAVIGFLLYSEVL